MGTSAALASPVLALLLAGLNGVVAVAGYAYYSSALKADGTVVQWGSNHNDQATVPAELSHVVALAGGLHHALVIVQSPPVLTADSPPTTATTTAPYTYTFAATGTPTPTFAVTAGSLPPGLSLSSSGQFAGTSTTPGTYTFSVRASNGVSPAATGASHTATVPVAPTAPEHPVPCSRRRVSPRSSCRGSRRRPVRRWTTTWSSCSRGARHAPRVR